MERMFVTTKEVAELLGVSRELVSGWVADGKLKGVKFGKYYFIPVEEVEQKFGVKLRT